MARRKPQGHYCKICGERKSNESFSGKGHAAHICKACSRLSPQQQAEQITLNRLSELPMRYLSNTEIKWLKNRTSDHRPAVRELAREVYAERFPYAARNQRKQQLSIKVLELAVDSEVYDLYGDSTHINENYRVTRTPPAIRPHPGGRLDPDSGAPAKRTVQTFQVGGAYAGDFLLGTGFL